MKYTPSNCPKCGTELVKNRQGGRPTRWCCEGCKRSGEGEMTRLQSLLRVFEEGRAVDRLNGHRFESRDDVIRELQDRFDHLAGVRPSSG
jgi:hypothetical protein